MCPHEPLTPGPSCLINLKKGKPGKLCQEKLIMIPSNSSLTVQWSDQSFLTYSYLQTMGDIECGTRRIRVPLQGLQKVSIMPNCVFRQGLYTGYNRLVPAYEAGNLGQVHEFEDILNLLEIDETPAEQELHQLLADISSKNNILLDKAKRTMTNIKMLTEQTLSNIIQQVTPYGLMTAAGLTLLIMVICAACAVCYCCRRRRQNVRQREVQRIVAENADLLAR